MAFKLLRLVVTGPEKESATFDLSRPSTTIYGPSETGKSYVFQCIAYCLGGDTAPEEIPEAKGYQSIYLEIQTGRGSENFLDETEHQAALDLGDLPPKPQDGDIFTIVRGIQGGAEAVYRAHIEGTATARKLKVDCNELLKRLIGVSESVVFKKAGKKGVISAGPLRHWSMLSQTSIVAKESVLGDSNARMERSAALALMLGGVDDTAIEIGISTDARRAAGGGADAMRGMIESLRADLPPDTPKKDVEEALARVDETLQALSQQQKSRAQALEAVRSELAQTSAELRSCETGLAQSAGLVNRFKLLQRKYDSDFERLVSLDEGSAVYFLLDDVPCPLCGTTLPNQTKASLASPDVADKQRRAIAAEAAKIDKQRTGLAAALSYEIEQLRSFVAKREELQAALQSQSARERRMIDSGIDEFKVSATELARRRTELYTQARAFEEIARLTVEAAKLEAVSVGKNSRIERQLTQDGLELSDLVLQLIHAWGFESIRQVTFDAAAFDIKVDGRRRASFGQGVRALFLAAYYVALLQYAEKVGRPHPGFVVIDSPLKPFSDRKQGDPDVPMTTVNMRFYSWLADWVGPGQIVVLENEEPSVELKPVLLPLEFTKMPGVGRRGFFP
ncbi:MULTISPECIES: AAA family ATPase [Paraburkholderia]|uniref:AAA family ATPase n=1 Tax=Paraburkholderia TaxID=1822464 RepID=UPI0038BAAEF1